MAEEFVRMVNKSVQRFDPPVVSVELPNSRGVVNELSFRLFVAAVKANVDVRKLPKSVREECVADTVQFIRSFRQANRTPVRPPSRTQQREAQVLADRLMTIFGAESRPFLNVEPVFPGCGWIDECKGDVLVVNTLVEVKAGERPFRGADFRQLLVYGALNFAAKKQDIGAFCLLNPRLGVKFQDSVESLCRETSGRSSAEIFGEIIEYISEADTN